MKTSPPGRASSSRWSALQPCSPASSSWLFRSTSTGFCRCAAFLGGPAKRHPPYHALIACAFVLVPHQPATALGTELLILGGPVLVLLLLIVTPALRGPSLQPRSWHATRIIGIAAATIPTLLAGASLLHWLPGELYWLVAGVLAALVVGTGNAWVLLVEVVRDRRYQSDGS
jgi:hypothetical protein